jgi:hypothetical protein
MQLLLTKESIRTFVESNPLKCPDCGTKLKWNVYKQNFFCLNLANCSFEISAADFIMYVSSLSEPEKKDGNG